METDLLLQLEGFVERIAAIARTGLAFKPDGYDSQRYEELLKEAALVHAALARSDADTAEARRLRWRESVLSGYDGYVTTGVGGGAIVFNDRDELLMMKRPSGRWWYPTGFCDVGLSPAENVTKEVREEIGVRVRSTQLIGVIDILKVGGRRADTSTRCCWIARRREERSSRIHSRRSKRDFTRSRRYRIRCTEGPENGSGWRRNFTSKAGAKHFSIRYRSSPLAGCGFTGRAKPRTKPPISKPARPKPMQSSSA